MDGMPRCLAVGAFRGWFVPLGPFWPPWLLLAVWPLLAPLAVWPLRAPLAAWPPLVPFTLRPLLARWAYSYLAYLAPFSPRWGSGRLPGLMAWTANYAVRLLLELRK